MVNQQICNFLDLKAIAALKDKEENEEEGDSGKSHKQCSSISIYTRSVLINDQSIIDLH